MLTALLGAAPAADDHAPALVRPNGETISYGALGSAVAHAAAQLQIAGAREGFPVAVGVSEPAAFLIAALGAWEAGAPVVPLDLRAGKRLADSMASRSHARLVVRAASLAGELQLESLRPTPGLDERVALVLFTSGSSGPPKGVLLGRAGLRANVEGILSYLPVREHPRTALTLPLSYSYALVGQALTTLRAGGTLLLLGEIAYPPRQLEAMARLEARGLSTVPASLRLYARAINEGAPRPPLGYLASAGAALDAATAASVRAAFPQARFFNQYGLTECSPRVAAIEASDAAFALGAAGRALPKTQVFAEEGELFVRGPSVMLGYLDDADATARAIRSDGALRTGDAGRVDESGAIFVSGRADGVVKVAGERVGLDEVAAQLIAAGAREAAVVALPDEALGARLVAFVELGGVELAAIRAALRERLPPAKRPASIEPMDVLPRLPGGKIDRRALQKLAAVR